jgi:ribonuclease J
LILPGIDSVRDRLVDVVGLVLTHGHEDHIGAVPYLLKLRRDIPVFGTRLTLALVSEKLREHRIRDTDLREIDGDSLVRLDEFEIEFIPVNHSIPDAVGLFLRTRAGTVLHTGDFKMDQLPLDGRLTDLRRFAKLGEEGVDLFMVDSTNAEVPGFTTPEKDIQPAMQRVYATSQRRLLIACFASHVHRVQQVLDEAVRYHRKVVYVGRSMIRNMAIARDLGYLTVPGDTLIDLREIDKYKPSEVVIICTGSQGEPLSALARMANREHPVIELEPGDTVLLASSLIPGNENSVHRVINGLSKLGARVVHRGNALVHVSGHASAGELLYCYNIVRPRNVLPVHGEIRHLIANADLAVATGVPRDHTFIIEDGDVVDLQGGVMAKVGRVDASYVFVDGSTVGALSDTELTDRRILGEEGFITILAVVNTHSGQLITGPDIHARGFAEDDTVFDGIRDELAAALRQALDQDITDPHRLQQIIRRNIGRWVNRTYRRRPMIVPVVVET